MLDNLRHFLAISLIAIAGFLQPNINSIPAKIKITPTPIIKINTIQSPTEIPLQQPQVKKCQFNKEQMTTFLKQFEYTDEEINIFFEINKGDCFNPKEKTTSQEIEELENKVQGIESCQKEMDSYADCIENENQDLETYKDCMDENSRKLGQYSDCINSAFNKYCYEPMSTLCSKPITGFCYKPSCSY